MLRPCLLAAAIALVASPALAFEIDYEWGEVPACTVGDAQPAPTPKITIKDVPEGTVRMRLKLVNINSPEQDHGSINFDYEGQTEFEPGAYEAKRPCLVIRNQYQWQAIAFDANKKVISTAKSEARAYQ